MNVVVLGSTGMLGNVVGKYLINNTKFKVKTSYRNEEYKYGDSFHFDPCEPTWINTDMIANADYVINCIGKIKPHMKSDMQESIYINSIFPRVLADMCKKFNNKLIHITTDCVYSGKGLSYTEEDVADAEDDYGKTKSLGEPDNCMVLRTSIIGEEVHDFVSLISWIKSMKGMTVNGYTNHYWNGITTNQYARICEQIINDDLYSDGVSHVFSNSHVTKFDLVSMVDQVYDLSLKITQSEAPHQVDRTLGTVKSLNSKLLMVSLREQLATMRLEASVFGN